MDDDSEIIGIFREIFPDFFTENRTCF